MDKKVVASKFTQNINPISRKAYNDIIDLNNGIGDNGMDNNKITNRDFKQLEKVQDLKLDYLEEKMDMNIKNIADKIDFSHDKTILEFKNILLEQSVSERKEREKAQRETRRWFIGIAVSITIFTLTQLFQYIK